MPLQTRREDREDGLEARGHRDPGERRDQLVERGVDGSPVRHVGEDGQWFDGHGGAWNAFVFFDDPDGNSWAVQEKPAG
ncbi:hypothetical protein [Pseudonocardia sp. T1-2H]|uniref:hypothetical protein n=1 Tax=Pseudonocardia sp. T1-2H TaxID=3128899 RepID=UPI003100FA89